MLNRADFLKTALTAGVIPLQHMLGHFDVLSASCPNTDALSSSIKPVQLSNFSDLEAIRAL